MLRVNANLSILRNSFQTSAVFDSKISKRRKDTKLKESPNLRQKVNKRKTSQDLALEFFDGHYKQIYGSEWHKIRLALLSKPKFAALVNNFSAKSQVIEQLKSLGCLSIKDLYSELKLPADATSDSSHEVNILLDELSKSNEERPSFVDKDDLEEEPKVASVKSMSKIEALDRLVEPDNIVIGGKRSASMYEFVPPIETKSMMDGFIEESEYYDKFESKSRTQFSTIKEKVYDFPVNLEAFIFPEGRFDSFSEPKRLYDGPFNYYCLNASSILPVLMLDLQKGDHLLDMCASPGGKSLAAMQTLLPKQILCNDIESSRTFRVSRVMSSFLLDKFNHSLGHDAIQFSTRNGVTLPEIYECHFDKVLCDVPCFTDRHELFDGNLFSGHRTKERLRLPQLQASLLVAAIKCLKPGGSVVYSTCTLSPMQNDGAVALALKMIWEETTINVVLCDLTQTIEPYKAFLDFSSNCKVAMLGQQVVPSLARNFGPMYFAKIKRLS